jgi:predicted RNA polymerase sigma factor
MAAVRHSTQPGAWLMAAAKHRAIDHFRRHKMLDRKHEELGRELEVQQERAVADSKPV